MKDKPSQAPSLPNVQPSTDAPSVAASTEGKAARSFISKGERAFEEITYRGVNWGLNTVAAVGFGFWSARTHAGRTWFRDPVRNFFRGVVSRFSTNKEFIDKSASGGATLASITFGGFITIPPTVWLEKNKESITRWFDKKIYGEEVVAENPKFEKAYEEIRAEPQKDFLLGMGARFTSLVPFLMVLMAVPKTLFGKPFMEKGPAAYDKVFTNWMSKSSRWVTDKIGLKPKSLMDASTIKPELHGDSHDNWTFLHRLTALDISMSFMYSYIFEGVYKAFSWLAHGGKASEPLPTLVSGNTLHIHAKRNTPTGKALTATTEPPLAPATDAASEVPRASIKAGDVARERMAEAPALAQGAPSA